MACCAVLGWCMFEIGAGAPVWGAWGKAGKEPEPHPLICHALDTAAVADELYDALLGPQVRRDLESGLSMLGDTRSWVAVLCGLHDIGKCTPIFQSMEPDLAIRYLGEEVRPLLTSLNPESKNPDVRTPHGMLTTTHLSECLKGWGADIEVRTALAYGLGGHHGSMPSAHSVRNASNAARHHGGEPWRALRTKIVRTVAELWGLGDPADAAWNAVSLTVPAMVGLAGLTSVSDWIASDDTNFPWAKLPLPDSLDTYRDRAKEQAARAVRQRLRWTHWTPPADTSYSALFGEKLPPLPLQRVVEAVVAEVDEPGVLVIEAPTGEGKTRTGFQAAATLANRLGLSGMYVALPTRASAGHIHAELAEVADGLGIEEPPNLVQGTVRVDPSEVDEDGDGAHDGHGWFTRKRGLLFPIGVGTIDQVLQAAITSRHVFVRLTGLSGKVLVIDEAHDLDAHMTTLLRRVLWWCGRLGVPVVLMSATLPSNDREHLLAHWLAGRRRLAPGHAAPRAAGPGGQQVMWVSEKAESKPRPIELSETNAQRPPISVQHLSDDELTGWLRERVASHGCALVVRNLVRDAQRTHTLIEKEITTWDHQPELVLLTGHTPKQQRDAIEKRLRQRLGPKTKKRPHIIVIGTQVLQHSLDLDFDLLASDLAPINELIQRLGRVHRHDRAPGVRACPSPQFGLIQPPGGKLGDADERGGPRFARGLHTVYPPALLLRTWKALSGRAELKLPMEAAALVHEVYTAPIQLDGPLRHRFDKAAATMSTQDNNDESRVRRFYLHALAENDSIRELTSQPTLANRSRKEAPWKERS